jgi:phage baseplate assembly protein W
MAASDVVLRGLAFPFRRDATDLAVASSVAQVEQNIATVLTTPCGTLPWRPDFGSHLHRLRHSNSAATSGIAENFTQRALKRWVPYVRLVRATVTIEGTALRLRVVYRIVSGPLAQAEPIEQSVTITT